MLLHLLPPELLLVQLPVLPALVLVLLLPVKLLQELRLMRPASPLWQAAGAGGLLMPPPHALRPPSVLSIGEPLVLAWATSVEPWREELRHALARAIWSLRP